MFSNVMTRIISKIDFGNLPILLLELTFKITCPLVPLFLVLCLDQGIQIRYYENFYERQDSICDFFFFFAAATTIIKKADKVTLRSSTRILNLIVNSVLLNELYLRLFHVFIELCLTTMSSYSSSPKYLFIQFSIKLSFCPGSPT